jgi:hypothetical protein
MVDGRCGVAKLIGGFMGCLNSNEKFDHWFGNIHLSGRCNRSCYFCIGQHMMDLDSYDVLRVWPLPNLDGFSTQLSRRPVKEICLTGTNTDPLLYAHHGELTTYLRQRFPDVPLAIRTNAAAYTPELLSLYDRASFSICSFDPDIYVRMMGQGKPPNLECIVQNHPNMRLKVNVVLGPENIGTDLMTTLTHLSSLGMERVNLREPYGQPHIGDPLAHLPVFKEVFGMPCHLIGNMQVTYWDVHYVEVESVNLYASGRVSETYPITLGHSLNGEVHDQSFFKAGRHREQWVTLNSYA